MAEKPKKASRSRSQPALDKLKLAGPQKQWRHGADLRLNKSIWDGLYPVYLQIDKETFQNVGLMLKIPVFIKDPLVALENPTFGAQKISAWVDGNIEPAQIAHAW
jgi:hypothetical protein